MKKNTGTIDRSLPVAAVRRQADALGWSRVRLCAAVNRSLSQCSRCPPWSIACRW